MTDTTEKPDADPAAPRYESAALITIDVQRDVLDGQPLEVPGTSAALSNLARLCEAFRAAGLPIVHIVRLYNADGSNAERSRRTLAAGPVPVFRPGTPGRLLAPELLPPDTHGLDDELLLGGGVQRVGSLESVIFKPRWGAFYNTPLDTHLRDLGVSTLVFSGCNFPNCPRTSIYEASERDYRVVLAADAMSGVYARGIAELTGIGVTCTTTGDIIDQIQA